MTATDLKSRETERVADHPMPGERSTPIRSNGVWTLIVSLLAITPFVYSYAARLVVDIDPFSYAQYGKLLLEGKRLYSEVLLDKGPLVPLFFAIPQLFVPRSMSAVGFFGGICLVVQAVLIGRTLRVCPLGFLACTLVLIAFPLIHSDSSWLSTEILANFFVIGVLLLTHRIARDARVTWKQAFWIGVLPILAFNARQTTLLSAIAPAVVLLSLRQPIGIRIKALLVAVGGGLVTFGLILALVALIGNGRSYLYAMFVFPYRYINWTEWPQDPRVALVRYFFSLPVSCVTVLAFGLAMTGKYRWLAVGGLLSGIAICLIPKRPYIHYLVSLHPFIAIWIGIVFDQIRSSSSARRFGWVAVTAIVASVLTGVISVFSEVASQPLNLRIERIAAQIDRVAPPGATLTTWGPGGTAEAITFASRLPQANPMGWTDMLPYPICKLMPVPVDQVMQEYMDRPPVVLAVYQELFSTIKARGEGKLDNDLKLLKMLTDKYPYRNIAVVDSFLISVRMSNETMLEKTKPGD